MEPLTTCIEIWSNINYRIMLGVSFPMLGVVFGPIFLFFSLAVGAKIIGFMKHGCFIEHIQSSSHLFMRLPWIDFLPRLLFPRCVLCVFYRLFNSIQPNSSWFQHLVFYHLSSTVVFHFPADILLRHPSLPPTLRAHLWRTFFISRTDFLSGSSDTMWLFARQWGGLETAKQLSVSWAYLNVHFQKQVFSRNHTCLRVVVW